MQTAENASMDTNELIHTNGMLEILCLKFEGKQPAEVDEDLGGRALPGTMG